MEESKSKLLLNNIKNNKNISLKKSFVNKISAYQRLFLLKEENEKLNNKQENLNKKSYKNISLKKVFQEPKKYNSKIWPKITHPKLPFSKKNLESPEFKKLKKRLQKPSLTFHGYNTIRWLRHKYSNSVIEKSIYTLLPKKNYSLSYKNERETEKRHREMLEYLNSFKGPIGKERFVNINPKYLFNESTFKKILKLREIFLEFDSRGNLEMDFDEIVKMFNQNHIKADKNDIVNLFFKDKKIKKEDDILKLHLDFYQFINFALEKEQDFREFMRRIKQKYKKKEDDNYDDKDEYNTKKSESVYLPMNFNLVLDYFINKEKERHSIDIMKNAFEQLDNDIKTKDPINYSFSVKEKLKDNSFEKVSNKNLKIDSNFSSKKSNKLLKLFKEEDNLSDINFSKLFNELTNLFNLSSKNEGLGDQDLFESNLRDMRSAHSRNKTVPKRTSIIADDFNSLINITKNKKTNNNRNNKSNFENYIFLTEPNNNLKRNKKDKKNENKNKLIFLIKNQMNINMLNKINLENLKKYHDLRLAKEATLKQIKDELELEKMYKNLKKPKTKSLKTLNIKDNKTFNSFIKN